MPKIEEIEREFEREYEKSPAVYMLTFTSKQVKDLMWGSYMAGCSLVADVSVQNLKKLL